MPYHVRPVTAPELTPHYYSDIERAMVEPYEHSFTTQVASLQARGAWPEVFLLTAQSAIPVADAVRGYCDMAGYETPLLGTIQANSDLALDFSIGTRAAGKAFATEVERLNTFVAGCVSACVIDQYVVTGNTLALADMMLEQVGVPQVSHMRGKWYQDAGNKDELDPIGITSLHSHFMYNVGVKACQQVLT